MGDKAARKAMQFDVEAMFEAARQTAVETSRATLEARETEEVETRRALEEGMRISGPTDSATASAGDTEEEEDIGPDLPPGFGGDEPSTSKGGDSGVDEEDDDDEYDDFQEVSVEKLVPAASEATFEHSHRAITALGVDMQGARLMTGCLGSEVKLWDFAGMDAGFKSFRTIRPFESHILKSLAFSLNGEKVLVCSGHNQAKVLERNGKEWAECIKGDNYLHDAKKTKGHTAALNGGAWHPWSREEFLTCSDDGTVRLWSLEDFKIVTNTINTNRTVIRTKTGSGMKIGVSAACYSKYVPISSHDEHDQHEPDRHPDQDGEWDEDWRLRCLLQQVRPYQFP